MRVADIQRYFRVEESVATTISQLVAGKVDPCEVSPACDRWVRKCYNEPAAHEQILEAINELIGGYGVEAVFDDIDPDSPAMSYVNMGDTYRTTILYDDSGYHISTMGDWIESRESEE